MSQNINPRDIEKNLAAVRSNISEACASLGRSEPRLIAVSKTHSPDAVLAAWKAGQREFGENYGQELAQKRTALAAYEDLHFIFIGRLQSNKIKSIVRDAEEIQSLADLRHARLIAKAAAELGKTPYPVYYLVNAGDEPTKDGLRLEDLSAFHQQIIQDLPELAPQGLMAIPPPSSSLPTGAPTDEKFIPPLYLELRRRTNSIGRGLLSLGMSDDISPALAAGTDCVRIGTAIFGARG